MGSCHQLMLSSSISSRNIAACDTDETKLWFSQSAKQCQTPWSGFPPEYKDLSTCHDWPVKKAIVDLPIRLKGNSKRTSGNSLSPLGAQNKHFGAASQTLLTGVRLRLRYRLQRCGQRCINIDTICLIRSTSNIYIP